MVKIKNKRIHNMSSKLQQELKKLENRNADKTDYLRCIMADGYTAEEANEIYLSYLGVI